MCHFHKKCQNVPGISQVHNSIFKVQSKLSVYLSLPEGYSVQNKHLSEDSYTFYLVCKLEEKNITEILK